MKILKWVILTVVAATVILVATMSVAVKLRGKSLAERTPLTVEELDQLAKRLAPSADDEISQLAGTRDDTVSEIREHVSATLLVPLERTPSPEVLVQQFKRDKYGQRRRTKLKIALVKMMESTMWAVGAETAAGERAWELGSELMALGDWDGARHYLYEALDSPFPHTNTCANLAWLETDPEKAVRLLKLSCPENNVSAVHLVNAVELARATGSDALAEHYLARLRLQEPELAREYEYQ